MSKLVHDHRGGVTVFITLILVPSVLFISVFMELAIFAASSPYNAMKLEGESKLSNYNGLLKDTYGLMAISHSDPDRISGVGKLMLQPDGPSGALIGNDLSGEDFFNPMRNYNVDVVNMSIENIERYSLKNVNVLQTQISDYMKYRAAASFFSDIGSPVEVIKQFENLKDDSEAINSKAKLDKAIGDLNELYRKLYDCMVYNDTFDKGLRSAAVDVLNPAAVTIAESAAGIPECEDEIERYTEMENEHSCPSPPQENHSCPDYSSEKSELREEIRECKEAIDAAADSGREVIAAVTAEMDKYYKNIDPEIKETVTKIAAKLEDISALKAAHEKELGEASEDLKEALEDELTQYDEILDGPNLRTVFTDVEGNLEIATSIKEKYDTLTCGGVAWSSLSHTNATSELSEYTVDPAAWAFYRNTNPRLLNKLDGWYGKKVTDDVGKANGEKGNSKLEEELGSLKDKLLPTSDPGPRGAAAIPEQYKQHLSSLTGTKSGAEIGDKGMDVTDDLSNTVMGDMGGSSMDDVNDFVNGVGEAAMNGLHKVLLVEYQLGVFSHSTTGKGGDGGKKKEEEEESITGIPKSPKLNYMYGSELEYMYAGGTQAWQNQLASRGTMMGILFVRDFTVSYSVASLNKEIDKLGTAIACGNPMVAIATKLALRGLVTGMESGDELMTLLDGESIKIFKSAKDWKFSLSGLIGEVIGDIFDDIEEKIDVESGEVGDKPDLELDINYEQFMRFLLLAMVDRETLLGRTQDVIMLNLDNYESGAEADASKMPGEPSNDTSKMWTTVDIMASNEVGFLTRAAKMFGLEGINGSTDKTRLKLSY